MVQTLLFGIQSYWAQLLIIPAKIIKLIEGQITKKALMAWEKVCGPKAMGGMRLINIQIWNKAAITKLCWDLAHKKDKV